jgi:hypothetical protein
MVEEKCGISECTKPAERSVSKELCEKAGLKPADEEARRIHLCREHAKELKKATKGDRKLEALGR